MRVPSLLQMMPTPVPGRLLPHPTPDRLIGIEVRTVTRQVHQPQAQPGVRRYSPLCGFGMVGPGFACGRGRLPTPVGAKGDLLRGVPGSIHGTIPSYIRLDHPTKLALWLAGSRDFRLLPGIGPGVLTRWGLRFRGLKIRQFSTGESSSQVQPTIDVNSGVLTGSQHYLSRSPCVFRSVVMTKRDSQISSNGGKVPPTPVSVRPSASRNQRAVQPSKLKPR